MFEGAVVPEENQGQPEAPFEVTEPIEGGEDLTGVKPSTIVVPAASKILVQINKVTAEKGLKTFGEEESSENPVVTRSLNASFRLMEPILVAEKDSNGNFTGENVPKYQGTVLFKRIMTWADPNVKNSDWYKKKQHLLDYKAFLLSLGYDITSTPKIDDQFLTELTGRQLRMNILVKPRQVLDPATGKWIDTTEMVNQVKGFTPADTV